MAKVLWLVGFDDDYRNRLGKFLATEVDCQLFQDSQTAFASINGRGKPNVVITAQDNATSVFSQASKLVDVPVMVSTKKPCFDTACKTLQQGAADFFHDQTPAEIIAAKVKHCIEKPRSSYNHLFDGCKIDNIYRKITTPGGRTTAFTSKEFQIIMAFARRQTPTISRNDLIFEVWGGVKVGQKTLDVHLFNIRKKIGLIQLEIRFEAPNSYTLCSLKQAAVQPRSTISEAATTT